MDQLQSSSFLFAVLIFLLFIFRVLKVGCAGSQPSHSKPNFPPGPWKLPIIGSLHHLVSSGSLPHHTLSSLAKKYGPLMHLRLGELSTIVVSSAEIAEEVLRTHDIKFSSRPEFLSMKILTFDYADIAFSPYNELWRQLRKICTLELLTMKRVQSFRWIREEEASKLIKRIASKAESPVNLTQHITSTTFSIISRAAFGKECSAKERFSTVVQEAVVLAGVPDIADIFPSYTFLHWISRTRPKVKRLHREFDNIMKIIISEHREARQRATRKDEASEDLVDVLLKFEKRDDQGFSLSTTQIKGVVLDMFAAGGETSATTVDWAMAEMINKPRILEKAQDEVRRVFDGQGEVREDSLAELQYLKSVVKEVLRLHPPLPLLLPRVSGERCMINGFEIPRETRAIINMCAIGKDPKYWTDPETFSPERFLNSPIDYKGNHFEYIPFGAGRRICPGINFGIANVEYLLAMLLYHFDWKLPDGMKNEDLDMTEIFGAVTRRKVDLYSIPIPYNR